MSPIRVEEGANPIIDNQQLHKISLRPSKQVAIFSQIGLHHWSPRLGLHIVVAFAGLKCRFAIICDRYRYFSIALATENERPLHSKQGRQRGRSIAAQILSPFRPRQMLMFHLSRFPISRKNVDKIGMWRTSRLMLGS